MFLISSQSKAVPYFTRSLIASSMLVSGKTKIISFNNDLVKNSSFYAKYFTTTKTYQPIVLSPLMNKPRNMELIVRRNYHDKTDTNNSNSYDSNKFKQTKLKSAFYIGSGMFALIVSYKILSYCKSEMEKSRLETVSQDLIEAAKKGNSKEVVELLKEGFNLKKRVSDRYDYEYGKWFLRYCYLSYEDESSRPESPKCLESFDNARIEMINIICAKGDVEVIKSINFKKDHFPIIGFEKIKPEVLNEFVEILLKKGRQIYDFDWQWVFKNKNFELYELLLRHADHSELEDAFCSKNEQSIMTQKDFSARIKEQLLPECKSRMEELRKQMDKRTNKIHTLEDAKSGRFIDDVDALSPDGYAALREEIKLLSNACDSPYLLAGIFLSKTITIVAAYDDFSYDPDSNILRGKYVYRY